MRKRTKEFYDKMNKIMEELGKTNLSKWEGKYAWVLFRQSFGYGDEKVKRSRSKMAELTGISETHISDTEKRLKERNIIQIKGKIKGFNLNTDEWKKVPLQGPFQKVPLQGQKGPATRTKRSRYKDTIKTKVLKKTPRRENFYIKLSRKEIDKLELEDWYKAIMWNVGKFSIFYIEGTISDYPYNTRMSCWYIYEDSGNIRNKEAYFSKLLANYQEDLEK